TLEAVLQAVADRLVVNVEIKSWGLGNDGSADQVAAVITRCGMQDRVIVSSFNPLTLRRFRAVLPDVAVGVLCPPTIPLYISEFMVSHRYEARHPHFTQIDKYYAAWASGQGYRINAWTVNDPADAIKLRDMGVDGIITDKPAEILAAVRHA
ncbi:MAG: glycerophosphodiester phosphodiesterase, partial [Chloroflexi bacterium]|nr:glycerophosphodiester phosphodiesterase [Chloroflexota bacterium]